MILNKEKILEDITLRHGVPYKDIKQTDPCIVPALILLNELGYKTKYSCQGHRKYEKAYIMFEDNLKEREFKFLFRNLCHTTPYDNTLSFVDSNWDANIWIRVVQNEEIRVNAMLEVREISNNARLRAILVLTSALFTLCFEDTLLSAQKQKLKNYCKALIQELEEHLT